MHSFLRSNERQHYCLVLILMVGVLCLLLVVSPFQLDYGGEGFFFYQHPLLRVFFNLFNATEMHLICFLLSHDATFVAFFFFSFLVILLVYF